MKKLFKSFGVIALVAVLLCTALSLTGCPDGSPKTLLGNITISPSADVTTGMELTANYSGSEKVTYLWKKGETNVGTNSNKYTPTEAGSYTVTVSAEGYISKTSTAVTVTEVSLLELPGNVTISPSGDVSTGTELTANYSGTETVNYQWNKDGAAIPGATGNKYVPPEAGSYTVTISATGYISKTSTAVIVTGGGDSALPVISIHPTSVDYGFGDTIAALSVSASSSDNGTLTYQWYENTTFSNTGGTSIVGAVNADYIPSLGGKTENFYYAVITNTATGKNPRSITSNPARVKVLSSPQAAPAVTVEIGNTNAQYVRGFGGMSNAFEISPSGVAQYMELKDIDTMFNPDTGLGFNILRIMLWPNPLEDVISGQVEPQMNNQDTYLEVVKRVNKYGGYVMATPWTPPSEWKVNGVVNGDSPSYLLPEHYVDYAEYLANFARQMAGYGAPIYTLSIQNEPTLPVSYEGCEWTPQQMLDFLKTPEVGKFLNGVPGYGGGKARESVLVMSDEPHQNIQWNDAVKNDAAANAIIDIYAYHMYGSMNGPYLDVQQDTTNGRKEVWMTEHNVNSGGYFEQDYSWDYVWRVAEEIDHVIRVNSTNAFMWWYLKRCYSMVGDNAYGTVNGEVLPRGWVMSHWAKYATDTVRIPAVVSGHPGIGNASDASNTGVNSSTKVKASAFRRKAAPVSWVENQVRKREDSISLVIFDQRTDPAAQGQDIRVSLPADFGAAKSAHAIISDSTGKRQAPILIVLAADGKTADFNLPANSIVSIKFAK